MQILIEPVLLALVNVTIVSVELSPAGTTTVAVWFDAFDATRRFAGTTAMPLTVYGKRGASATPTLPAGTWIGAVHCPTSTLRVVVNPGAVIVKSKLPVTNGSAACLQTSM